MNKLLLLFLLFLIDIATKQIVFYSIDLNNFFPIFFFLDLAHIHNFGISFGLFSGWASSWFFVFLGLIVTFLIIYMMIQSKNKIEKWGFLLIIAGALSNIFDRALNGYVIDYIYLHFEDFYWPAFNFADIYISIGVSIIVVQILTDLKKRIFK